MKNKIRIFILGTCILILILIGVGAFYIIYKGVITAHATNESASSTSTPSPLPASTSTTQNVTQERRHYSNKAFHFSLLYPDNLHVQEYAEYGGGFTVTFQDDIETDQEFQVYVTPYSDSQISEARFKSDEPSGVRNNQTDVVVDGARGTMFFSSYPRMNDTREVWFIHGGYLYEVTTYKELDSWLAQIMQTWKFI